LLPTIVEIKFNNNFFLEEIRELFNKYFINAMRSNNNFNVKNINFLKKIFDFSNKNNNIIFQKIFIFEYNDTQFK
jgi:hypothetical protein